MRMGAGSASQAVRQWKTEATGVRHRAWATQGHIITVCLSQGLKFWDHLLYHGDESIFELSLLLLSRSLSHTSSPLSILVTL